MKYDSTGRQDIAFLASSVAGRYTATFVSSLNALNPPLAGGPALVRIERSCRISRVTLMAYGGTGSCVVDIWTCPYADYPPVVGDSLTGGNPPEISSGTDFEDSTLTGWSRDLTEGDVLAFNLDSSSTFTKVVVVLEVE